MKPNTQSDDDDDDVDDDDVNDDDVNDDDMDTGHRKPEFATYRGSALPKNELVWQSNSCGTRGQVVVKCLQT
jgi:hypothetical protein